MIQKLWFENNRVYISLDNGNTLSRPLEAFPTLLDAPENLRNDYEISQFGDAIRWRQLDEDIHISSFEQTSEPNPDNEIGQMFKAFPWLNVSEVAKTIGINKSLLAKYIYGIKTPSAARRDEIKAVLHAMGRQLMSV